MASCSPARSNSPFFHRKPTTLYSSISSFTAWKLMRCSYFSSTSPFFNSKRLNCSYELRRPHRDNQFLRTKLFFSNGWGNCRASKFFHAYQDSISVSIRFWILYVTSLDIWNIIGFIVFNCLSLIYSSWCYWVLYIVVVCAKLKSTNFVITFIWCFKTVKYNP